jgi:aryl-alcohol dehydrogenase-like predicted oxidoreductase
VEPRPLGQTGLEVSPLGLGAGHLDGLDDSEAARLIHGAVDLGITFIDTARGYGASEERLGRHLGERRHQVVLSTKGGYGVPGVPDWTPECITAAVTLALATLRTDHLDVFHLHSCPLEVARRHDLLGALEQTVVEGQVRVAAYSGENDALAWAVESGRFGAVQCSVNPFDQRVLREPPSGLERVGVIGKRPLGNAPWRFASRPTGHYAECYWERWRAMLPHLPPGLDGPHVDWADLALRFGAFSAGVSTVIVGTGRLDHLVENLARVERGPLGADVHQALSLAFTRAEQTALAAGQPAWTGQV